MGIEPGASAAKKFADLNRCANHELLCEPHTLIPVYSSAFVLLVLQSTIARDDAVARCLAGEGGLGMGSRLLCTLPSAIGSLSQGPPLGCNAVASPGTRAKSGGTTKLLMHGRKDGTGKGRSMYAGCCRGSGSSGL